MTGKDNHGYTNRIYNITIDKINRLTILYIYQLIYYIYI